MNNWKVILATMVIFGTGVVTGGLLVNRSDTMRGPRQHPPNAQRPSVPYSPGGMRVELLKRMSRELDLTPGQHEKIDHLLKESQERTRKLMEPIAPQLREEMERTREEFRRALTPEQQIRFDESLRQQQQKGQRPKDHPHPNGPADKPTEPK